MKVIVNNSEYEVQNIKKYENSLTFELGGKSFSFDYLKSNEHHIRFNEPHSDGPVTVVKLNKANTYQVFAQGNEAIVTVIPKVTSSGQQTLTEGSLTSPMPGKVFKVLKSAGETVNSGDAILILEAMKMEHTIRAQKDGTIKEIFFKEGEQVDGGVNLVEIE